MIGSFKIIGKTCYLCINKEGTLQKLKPLKWYYILFFAFKSNVLGKKIHINEIKIGVKNEND